MNDVLMRMRTRNKPTQTSSQYPHLWTLLETLEQSRPEPFAAKTLPVTGNISIMFAEDGERMREVVKRSNYRMTSKQPSIKNGRMVHCESQYEQEVCQVLEISPIVAAYREQPAMITYRGADDSEHLHCPDILIELTSGIKVFVEVKPQRAANDHDLASRTTVMVNLLKPLGYRYWVILPEQVRNLAYLGNARHLMRYCAASVPEAVWEVVRRSFRSNSTITLFDLIGSLENPAAKGWVYRLLLAGDINCDFSEPISDQSLINWNQH